nr:HalOD1 output domain-containing protein [Halopiger djelfimassiliensis]
MGSATAFSRSTVTIAYTIDAVARKHAVFDDEPISVAIAEAVATFRNGDVTTLDPLHYAINTDALERLFEPRANGVRSAGAVTFEYNGCVVTVSADGEIRVEAA